MIKELFKEGLVSNKVKEKRYNVCKSCDRFKKINKICEVCLCFMPAKTKLAGAECPKGKW